MATKFVDYVKLIYPMPVAIERLDGKVAPPFPNLPTKQRDVETRACHGYREERGAMMCYILDRRNRLEGARGSGSSAGAARVGSEIARRYTVSVSDGPHWH